MKHPDAEAPQFERGRLLSGDSGHADPRTTLLAGLRKIEAIPPRIMLLASFAGVGAINYAFGLTTGWLLSPSGYGLLAFAQTTLLLSGHVLQSGVPWSLTRSIIDKPDAERDALVRGASLANLGLAIALAAIVAALFAVGVLDQGFERLSILLIAVIAIPLFALIAVARATAHGQERFGASAGIGLSEIAVKALAGIGLVIVGFGATGAVAGILAGAVVASVIGLVYILRVANVSLTGAVSWPPVRIVAPMFGALLGLALLLNQDMILVKLLAGADQNLPGYYQAAIILANAPYFLVTSALIPVLYTQLARFTSVAEMRHASIPVLQTVAVLVVPFELVMILFPEAILGAFFPKAYQPGAELLRLLAVGNTIVIFVAILSAAFQAIGRPAIPARVLIAVTTIELIVLIAVVPRWKGEAAAASFVGAATVALLVLGFVFLRSTRADSKRPLWPWLASYAGALVVAGAAGLAISVIAGNLYIALAVSGPVYVVVARQLGLLRQPIATIMSRTRVGAGQSEGR